MKVDYTGRQVEITPALKKLTESRLRKLAKLLGDEVSAHAILTVERHRHSAEINVRCRSLMWLGVAETTDMYNSIIAAMDKIERQVKKQKERFRAQKKRAQSITHLPFSVIDRESVQTPSDGPRVIKTSQFAIKPMSVEEAVQEVETLKNDFIVFRNAESERLNVIYRRRDGHYGLIEPEV